MGRRSAARSVLSSPPDGALAQDGEVGVRDLVVAEAGEHEPRAPQA